MTDSRELPIGFTMDLSKHTDILKRFSELAEYESESIVAGARKVQSRNEMSGYVESVFK